MNVLVTGGTGSLGRALIARLTKQGIQTICFSRDEAKQYEMMTGGEFPLTRFVLGDIRNYNDIADALADDRIDSVVHAAALKQVPSCEYFPEQAVLTNCLGAQNLIRAVHAVPDGRITVVVGVSTDKACLPATVMGMTKAIQERMFIAANLKDYRTRFICVRYGNVVNSRGSVIPLFKQQLARGGPLTITDKRMTRFLVTLEQAVDTILTAINEAHPGEIYALDAPGAFIVDIADVMRSTADTTYTGMRPNEKLHEIIASAEERWVQRGKYIIILPALPELAARVNACHGVTLSSRNSVLPKESVEKLLREVGAI